MKAIQAKDIIDFFNMALLGCTVAPGFEYEDYISADRDELIKIYPDFTEDIPSL